MAGRPDTRPTGSVLPTVRAHMHERFIVNYRMPPEAVSAYLPAPWLTPQVIAGSAVASFCVLDLRQVSPTPVPRSMGLSMISCAPRYAVMDHSVDPPRPAVFVTERYSSSAFGSWFTTLGFSAPHPHIEVHWDHRDDEMMIAVSDEDGEMFRTVANAEAALSSQLFPTVDDFSQLIASGVRSYGLSRHAGELTVLDLKKDDATYEPYGVASVTGGVPERWVADGGAIDSAFRTADATYAWKYAGLVRV